MILSIVLWAKYNIMGLQVEDMWTPATYCENWTLDRVNIPFKTEDIYLLDKNLTHLNISIVWRSINAHP